MSTPFIAEIRFFAGNFAPHGWALCNGQLLLIAQNTALFSLLGTTYGGDGITTFALPDLRGRASMHPGRGPGLTARRLGERGGVETVTLTEAQMANHDHSIMASALPANLNAPGSQRVLSRSSGGAAYTASTGTLAGMAPQMVGNTGGSQAHNNMQPFLVLTAIIALVGLYPSRG